MARRITTSVLSVFERPAVEWMIHHLPRWAMPDHLTALGFFGAVLASGSYVAANRSLDFLWLASFGIILHWVGDCLDGTMARLLKIERPRYGFFIDHTADLFSQMLLFLCIGLSPCARFEITCLGLIAFLMAFVYSLIYKEVRGVMRITYFGFGPTEIRALFILGNLSMAGFGRVEMTALIPPLAVFGPLSQFDITILVMFFLSTFSLAGMIISEAAVLYREDPPHKR